MKNTYRRSLIWQLDRETFQNLINQCLTKTEILQKLGLNKGSYKVLQKRIIEENINIAHITEQSRTKQATLTIKLPLNEILVENSNYSNTSNLKKRLLKENILENKCYECNMDPVWHNKILCLQLDHKNGKNNDHRIENLRLLCPNCHSQTENYAGRNAKHIKTKNKFKKNKICLDCNKIITRLSTRCRKCDSKQKINKHTKIQWPKDKILLDMIKQTNFLQVSKKLGVSDNAIRKRLQKRGLL